MRLTYLKLAGFKSFVDPTTLHIHGQRVGVVGPNGCGKSNVMESVRWVLGESSAKEMRGDSMDAVIFNGSGNRKPISRASVELIFDNSMGSAAGEWSQYAEISVKRMIERDKGSTYYINNTVVRRRDVADLFLGTGLGGRAYAIIGQNTINRIVEAKPEELRIFLEEAAGISKYKERRRETELRLRDTRENLARVQDILRELAQQIVRLQSQAVVAAQYNALQESLSLTKGQIWLLKKQEASEKWQASQRFVEKLVNDLETQIAHLRHSESALETARQTHFDATDAMNNAQAKYYEVNADVSNLENQSKNLHDANERMKAQLQQLHQQVEKNLSQRVEVESAYYLTQIEQQTVTVDFSQTEQAISLAQDTVQTCTQAYQAVLATFNANQAAFNHVEQRLHIEQANLQYIQKSLNETQALMTRLAQQTSQLQWTDDAEMIEKQQLLTQAEQRLNEKEQESTVLVHQEQALNQSLKLARDAYQTQQKNLNQLEAQIASLNKIQQTIRTGNNESALSAWLKQTHLDGKLRLWQTIRMKAGWETALEAALGGKLNAIVHEAAIHHQRPPSALTLIMADPQQSVQNNAIGLQGKTPLLAMVEKVESQTQAVIEDWLAGIYILTKEDDAFSIAQGLNQGELLVNQQGDVYTKYSVTYFGPQTMLHGVLERQAEIDQLEQEVMPLNTQVEEARLHIATLENALSALRATQKMVGEQLRTMTAQLHQLKLSLQQLKQQQQHVISRQSALESERVIAHQKCLNLEAESEAQQHILRTISADVEQYKINKMESEAQKNQAEHALNEAVQHLQGMERAHQEKNFNIKLLANKCAELTTRLAHLDEEKGHLTVRQEELQSQLASSQIDAIKQQLTIVLNLKQTVEANLSRTREAQNASEIALQGHERERMKNEQMLHPLRDKVEASRLAEQEARLHFEQCQADLTLAELSEAQLVAFIQQSQHEELSRPNKIKSLETLKSTLSRDIETLGPVNLVAIQELAAEETRRDILDHQSNDLIEASDTLESAIKKIDKETRGRLQATFDEANMHFKSLFSTLFGGGEARLELLGDEILDTGMQVFAQPPGKKNSTIHLLSGGEKALTAIALVFALFRLNPAPFCLMDEVDAPLDDSNTERFCAMVKKMSEKTQFLYVSHNKITMEMAQQLIGVTMQESGVSRIVDVDMEQAVRLVEDFSV